MINNAPNVPNNGFMGKSLVSLRDATAKGDANQVTVADGGGLTMTSGPFGTQIDSIAGTRDFRVPMIIVDSGPNGEDTYSDGRYWARSITLAHDAGANPTDSPKWYIDSRDDQFWGTVFNAAELITGTHSLPEYSGDSESPISGPYSLVWVRPMGAGKMTSDSDDATYTVWVIDSSETAATVPIYHAIITGVTGINGAIRALYTIDIGYFDMTVSPTTGGTWTVTTSGAVAFNSMESLNIFGSGTGTIGTGNTNVAQSDGAIGGGSCHMKFLPVGGEVIVVLRGQGTTTTYYTIINAANTGQ